MSYIIEKYGREWMKHSLGGTLKTYLHALNTGFDADELAEIVKDNISFISDHGLRLQDVEIIKRMQKAITDHSFSTPEPIDLDAVNYTNEYGQNYPNALIAGDTYRNGTTALCESAGAHVYICDGQIGHSISGGSFPTIDPAKLIRDGEKSRMFWAWGSNGACGNGGLYFNTQVKKWVLSHD